VPSKAFNAANLLLFSCFYTYTNNKSSNKKTQITTILRIILGRHSKKKKSFHTKKIENLCRIFSLERGGKGWSMHGKRYMPFATLLCKLNTVTKVTKQFGFKFNYKFLQQYQQILKQ
jgi:hypothetical protein